MVRGQENRGAVGLEPTNHAEKFLRRMWVQGCRRLVQDGDARALHQHFGEPPPSGRNACLVAVPCSLLLQPCRPGSPGTLTRPAALGTLSRIAGEGGPSPQGLVGEGACARNSPAAEAGYCENDDQQRER